MLLEIIMGPFDVGEENDFCYCIKRTEKAGDNFAQNYGTGIWDGTAEPQ